MSDETWFSDQLAVETLRSRSLTVLVDTTNSCNLRCRMCWFSHASHADRAHNYMPVETFEYVARQVFPFAQTVYLSAATEPLMHPDFPSILAIAGRYQVADIKFLTNAQLLTAGIGEACIRNGVNEIHVSVDGATPETYEWIRRRASFDRLLRNLEELAEMKCRMGSHRPLVQFNITLMRRNISELGGLVRLAHRLGVQRIACRHLVVFEGLGMEDESLARDQARANESVEQGLREAAALGIGVVQFPDFFTEWKADQPPWGPAALEADTTLPSATPFSVEAAGSSVGARLRRCMWRRLPAQRRWQWQAARLRARQQRQDKYPIGRWDEPKEDILPGHAGMLLAGWALHRGGIDRVALCRELLSGESPDETNDLGLVPFGIAKRHNGTRPDVAVQWPDYPERHQAGWTFRISSQLLPETAEPIHLHAVGYGRDGRFALLGSRVLVAEERNLRSMPLYCRKPYDFVYIDPSANVFPHPECRIAEPCGSLASQGTFETIWRGEIFSELRHRIASVNPPPMCRSCPDFINRCVDDPSYFSVRPLV